MGCVAINGSAKFASTNQINITPYVYLAFSVKRNVIVGVQMTANNVKMSYNSMSSHTDKVHPVGTDFTNIALDAEVGAKKKTRVPIRIIHCSDGILEEYSTDEDEADGPPLPPPVDPKTLNWGWWSVYIMKSAAFKTLGAADFCGEKLAWFFGITTPKYQSAIDEFYRLKRQEDEEERCEQRRLEKMEGLSGVKVAETADTGGTGAGDTGENVQKF